MASDEEKCFQLMTSSWGLHPARGRHGKVLISWALLFTWRMICCTSHAAYINYDQYCVCRCLVQRLHPNMGRHSIVLALVSWALLSPWHMICGTIHAAYINFGQYCVCRCLVQRRHPAMGRHNHSTCICKLNFTICTAYDLWCHPCCIHKLWSILCLSMSGAETASSHGQARHSTCTCKLSFTIYMAYRLWCHPCCVHKLLSLLCLPMSGAERIQPWADTA